MELFREDEIFDLPRPKQDAGHQQQKGDSSRRISDCTANAARGDEGSPGNRHKRADDQGQLVRPEEHVVREENVKGEDRPVFVVVEGERGEERWIMQKSDVDEPFDTDHVPAGRDITVLKDLEHAESHIGHRSAKREQPSNSQAGATRRRSRDLIGTPHQCSPVITGSRCNYEA